MSFTAPADIESETSLTLTTREAGELIGRSLDAVKSAILRGGLPAERTWDGWRIRREDVLAWAASSRPRPPRTHRSYDDSAQLLVEYGSLTADELSRFQGVHVGNARKYLCLLAVEGRAHRHDDGEWFPGSSCPSCLKEAAS